MKRILIEIYLFFRRHVFNKKGLSRISFFRNVNFAIENFLKRGRQEMVIKHGVKIFLDPRQSLAEKFGPYEPEFTAIVKKCLKPGDTFVDVGASIGWFTLIAAKLVGPSGKVYSFEPEPHSFEFLNKNIEANGFQDIVIAKQAAVSDYTGKIKFFTVGNAWMWSSLNDPRRDNGWWITGNFQKNEDKTVYEYEVDSIRLDDYFADKKIDIMKVDVEGAADRVFKGALKTTEHNPNMKLLIEH